MPGVQNPHWSAWCSQNASWSGWSLPSRAKPSTVVTSAPSAWTASIKQARTLWPSTSTVQAPHTPYSQPMWVPVSPRSSRRESTRSRRGSTVSWYAIPFTFSSISRTVASRARLAISPPLPAGPLPGLGHRANRQNAGDVTPVVGRRLGVVARGDRLLHRAGRRPQCVLGDAGALQDPLRLPHAERGVADPADSDPDPGALPPVPLEEDRHPGEREVARAAAHLEEYAAAAGRGDRHADLGQELGGIECAGEGTPEKVGGRDGPLAARPPGHHLALEREECRGNLGGRVRVGEVSADRAPVADREVSDVSRRLGEEGRAPRDRVRARDGVEPAQRPEGEDPGGLTDVGEGRDSVDVDHDRRTDQPQV